MFSVVTGAQFGDEGKGKLVDWLAEQADVVVRFQGGDNAGHTVQVNDTELKLKLLPSGVLEEKRLLIGPGTVINPEVLLDEIRELEEHGVDVDPAMLGVDAKASVIMPYHRELDALEEAARDDSIGTTKRGIGHAYQDKVSRDEIRMEDLTNPDRFQQKLDAILKGKRQRIQELGGDPDDLLERSRQWQEHGNELEPYLTDVSHELHRHSSEGRDIVVEGAQGTFLDIIHGTQKYVTSSSTIAGGVCPSLGVGPGAIDRTLGVMKAYITRVGAGPLPTELEGETGERLREQGNEFGTNTGRPRRCGWLDLVLGQKAVNLNGYDRLALTKLDVLSGFDEIKVCTGYRHDGNHLDYPPHTTEELSSVQPVYETLQGWDADITEADSIDDLPDTAKDYIRFVEKTLETPVHIVSVGPGRRQTLVRD